MGGIKQEEKKMDRKVIDKFWNDSVQVNFFKNKLPCPHIRKFLSKIKSPHSDRKALDLGCGGGRNTEMLVRFGFDTYGLDSSPAMVRTTRQRLSKFFLTSELKKRIILGSMLNLPYPNSRFNVIVSTGVYHQARSEKEYAEAIKESSRVLKKGGWIALNIFTNKIWDKTYTKVDKEKYTVITKEGLYMTLLPKKLFLEIMKKYNLVLISPLMEEERKLSTGKRWILRGIFQKK